LPETRIAKLFKNGSSQAVRLPAEFRFEGDEVYATRNQATGDVLLSNRPGTSVWRDFSSWCIPSKCRTISWRSGRWTGHPASYVIKARFPKVEAGLSAIEPSQVCVSVITRAVEGQSPGVGTRGATSTKSMW